MIPSNDEERNGEKKYNILMNYMAWGLIIRRGPRERFKMNSGNQAQWDWKTKQEKRFF